MCVCVCVCVSICLSVSLSVYLFHDHAIPSERLASPFENLLCFCSHIVFTCRYGLSLRNTFVLSGISSVATGLMFDIPMAVQPMKSIAAVALAADSSEEFTIESMLAAGMITASFVMVLGLSGLIDAFNK